MYVCMYGLTDIYLKMQCEYTYKHVYTYACKYMSIIFTNIIVCS